MGATHARLADFSDCDFTGAQASAAAFERASLARAKMKELVADYATFEFADVRDVEMSGANCEFSVFVGASLGGTRAEDSKFLGVDFTWAEMDTFTMQGCDTNQALFPTQVDVAYGPGEAQPPGVEPQPLYRIAATPEERQQLLADPAEGATVS